MCGIYCIFFAIYLTIDYQFDDILSWFRDPQWNDISVYQWFIKRLVHRTLLTILTPERMLYCEFLG